MESTLVTGHTTQDNTNSAQEIFHVMHLSCEDKVGLVALKFDMEKVFDHMEWSFLLHILRTFSPCTTN